MDENLVGYLLNSLDPDAQRQVEEQLRAQPDEAAKLDRLRHALAPLAAVPNPPPSLVPDTLARVAQHQCQPLPPPPHPPPPGPRPPPAARRARSPAPPPPPPPKPAAPRTPAQRLAPPPPRRCPGRRRGAAPGHRPDRGLDRPRAERGTEAELPEQHA